MPPNSTNPNAVREKKTWQRGEQAEFRIKLLNKDNTPMSLDTTKYPAFAIYTPSGVLFQQGVMQQFSSPGTYRTLWTVPTNAEVSSDVGSWVFQVTAVRSKDLKQFEQSTDFNVIEKRIQSRDNRNVVQVCIQGSPYRAMWRGDFDPYELSLQMFLSSAPDDPQKAPIFVSLGKSDMTKVVDGSTIVYYYDVSGSSFSVAGDYTVLWGVRETLSSTLDNEYEQVKVIKKSIIKHIPSIRFAAERLPLDPEAPQRISDADIVEALSQGANMVNMYHPISMYTVENMPPTLLMHWQLLTLRWLLSSQHLVLGAQAFNFCVDKETYIKTEKGLVTANNLSNERCIENAVADVYKYMSKHRYVNGFTRFLEKYFERYGNTEMTLHISKIIKMFGAKNRRGIGPNGLVQFMHARGFQYFRRDYGRKRGYYVIDDAFIENVKHSVLGVYDNFTSSRLSKFKSDYLLDTPLGLQKTKAVWDFGDKNCLQIRTALGIKLTATKNHPVLTLNEKLQQTCVNMRDIKVGDWVAIDAHSEPNGEWELDLTPFIQFSEHQAHVSEVVDYTIPSKMTADLARVIGYLLSEGYIDNNGLINFTNSDKDLIKDYRSAFKRVFGVKPHLGFATDSTSTPGLVIKHYRISRKGIVRFLVALGMTTNNSCEKKIPWAIMRAPKSTAASFIQAYFEGDGCYSVNEKPDYTSRTGIISSCSERIREDMQLLLLRFGIVSSIPKKTGSEVGNLIISGISLDKYSEEIGWFKKGVGHKPSSKYYPQKEGLPPQVLNFIRKLSTGKKKYYNNETGKYECSGLGNYNPITKGKYFDYYASRTTYSHVRKYIDDKRSALKRHKRLEYRRLKLLLKTGFVWSQVESIENVGKRNVFDPELPDVKTSSGKDHRFSHLFVSNGIVTHNSGQTVSLDFDQTGIMDAAIGRIDGWVQETIEKAKIATKRSLSNNMSVGIRSTRPFGLSNRTFKYETVDGSGNYGQMLGTLSTLGLLP